MNHILKTKKARVWMLFLLAYPFVFSIIFIPQSVSAAVWGSAEIYVRGTHDSDSVLESDGHHSISLEASGVGSNYGEIAQSMVTGSLADATIGVYGYGEQVELPGDYAANSHGAVHLRDYITFYVPAGYYENGVIATLYGNIKGNLHCDSSPSGSSFYFEASFGSGNTFQRSQYSDEYAINEDFSLIRTIVPAGTTLSTDCEYTHYVYEFLSCSAVEHYGTIGYARADFSNGAKFTGLEVSPGVSWDSDSGVFLSNGGTIPTVTGWGMIMFSIILAGLAFWVIRKKMDQKME